LHHLGLHHLGLHLRLHHLWLHLHDLRLHLRLHHLRLQHLRLQHLRLHHLRLQHLRRRLRHRSDGLLGLRLRLGSCNLRGRQRRCLLRLHFRLRRRCLRGRQRRCLLRLHFGLRRCCLGRLCSLCGRGGRGLLGQQLVLLAEKVDLPVRAATSARSTGDGKATQRERAARVSVRTICSFSLKKSFSRRSCCMIMPTYVAR
jgi:hypothetical protein